MHDDRTAREGETERPCWNCGASPNIRCCEFGREPRDDLERTRASSVARHQTIDRDLSTIEAAVTAALVVLSVAITITIVWMGLEVLNV